MLLEKCIVSWFGFVFQNPKIYVRTKFSTADNTSGVIIVSGRFFKVNNLLNCRCAFRFISIKISVRWTNNRSTIMKVKFIFPIIIILLILNIHCKQNLTELGGDLSIMNQKVIFHFSYDNYAWGHSYYGWYIDNSGNIWRMNKVNHWWEEEMNVIRNENKIIYYDSDTLNQFYEECRDTIIATLNIDSLNYYSNLIKPASYGEYSEPTSGGNDIGSIIYGCLYYDKQMNKYRKIILSVDGDWVFKNLNSQAIKIDIWLKNL
jgi:hypothetical protein